MIRPGGRPNEHTATPRSENDARERRSRGCGPRGRCQYVPPGSLLKVIDRLFRLADGAVGPEISESSSRWISSFSPVGNGRDLPLTVWATSQLTPIQPTSIRL